jgi:Bax protein
MRSRFALVLAVGAAVAASTARASDPVCAEEPTSGEQSGANSAGVLLFADPSVKRSWAVFDTDEFDLTAVRRGARVPRVFLAALPQNIHRLRAVQDKRGTFIRVLLPVILAVNERIAADRRYLFELRRRLDAGQALPLKDEKRLQGIAKHYKSLGHAIDWVALIERVDVVPPSLAIAQSIVESGWGASLAARRSNALFGMIGGDGIDTAKLATFENIYASIAAYAHNLNTFGAYSDFRRQRAAMRVKGESPEGHALAMALHRYSELGLEYARHIQAVIDKESLSAFDAAQLRPSACPRAEKA